MARLHDVLDGQLADLVANRPSTREWQDAVAAGGHEYDDIDDGSIAWALARVPFQPDAAADYLARSESSRT